MKHPTQSPWRSRLGVAVIAVASATAGWALGQPGRDGPGLSPAAPAAPADRVAVVAGDEFGRDGLPASPVTSDAYFASCDSFAGDAGVVDLEALELTLGYGADSERYEALVRALEAAAELPPELLWRTYTTDPAEDMRLLALMTWADVVADDGAQVRAGLEGALYDSSPAVRAEALFRLDELDRYERMRADITAGASR